MNFFWLIALAMAAFIASILFTGRVRIRGELLADRSIQPRRFLFYVVCFTAALLAIIAEAINPPY